MSVALLRTWKLKVNRVIPLTRLLVVVCTVKWDLQGFILWWAKP